MNELKVIVPVEGEMSTFGMDFIPDKLVIMTWEEIFERSCYDGYIRFNPKLHSVQSKEEAFD